MGGRRELEFNCHYIRTNPSWSLWKREGKRALERERDMMMSVKTHATTMVVALQREVEIFRASEWCNSRGEDSVSC